MSSPRELVRDEILAMRAYRVAPAHGMVKLDAMENPHRLPPELAARLGEALARVPVNRYPDPTAAALKQRLREAMAIPAGLGLVLGNGSDELIQMLSLLVARPGARALGAEPSFVMYRVSATVAGLAYEGVPLAGDLSLDEAAMLAAIRERRPALVWISYPNNPTGNLYPRESILAIVRESAGLVAVDEAYHPFAGGATLMDEVGRHPNLVVVRTLSKLGLAGLRLGFAAGPREWIDEVEKIRPPYNVNALTLAAAGLLLEHRDVLEHQARAIVADRGALEAGLDRIRGVRRFPSSANFVLARVPDAARAFEALQARGILVRSFHGSHPLLANCLRITVGTAGENEKLLDALGAILNA